MNATIQKPKTATKEATSIPWEAARWGRLLAGLGVALFTALGLLLHPGWMLGTLLIAGNLVVTSLTNRCALKWILLRLGAREREDLFLPGGQPRPTKMARRNSSTRTGALRCR